MKFCGCSCSNHQFSLIQDNDIASVIFAGCSWMAVVGVGCKITKQNKTRGSFHSVQSLITREA